MTIAPAPVDPEVRPLLRALYDAAEKTATNPKPQVRHTIHKVPSTDPSAAAWVVTSWKTAEFAYRKAASVGVGKDLPTLARGLFTVATVEQPSSLPESSADAQRRDEQQRILARGYDKFFNVGEMPWTKVSAPHLLLSHNGMTGKSIKLSPLLPCPNSAQPGQPASIELFSSSPYLLTFKENGCIIFIAALSPNELVVTSKHALESIKAQPGQTALPSSAILIGVDEDAGEVEDLVATAGDSQSRFISHAAKGEQWLSIHLQKVGRTKQELAAELWRRGETAVAELCDDTFEEHVLAYPPERSGLHLHGLNANTVDFKTRSMQDVEAFAVEWGFIPTRYITMNTMQEVYEFTEQIGATGMYQGEAIEGFVVRTAMPASPVPSGNGAVSPPYKPHQTWFYKVKFDEPYLMYRDWRELAKKMIAERKKWDAAVGDAAVADSALHKDFIGMELDKSVNKTANGVKKSKNQLRREQKVRRVLESGTHVLNSGTFPLPSPPKARLDRPETKLFVQWCYDRLYGSEDGRVRPQLALFEGLNIGRGIIRLREMFLLYLESEAGREDLIKVGGAKSALAAKLGQSNKPPPTGQTESPLNLDKRGHDLRASRPYTHLLIVPIAVPGCGKTSLFIALCHLWIVPGLVGHIQSDDVKAKKTGPTFLKNICEELRRNVIVLADRNNHLLKHRDEIVEAVRLWEERGGISEDEFQGFQKQKKQGLTKTDADDELGSQPLMQRPKVKIVALSWSLDLHPLNTLHRMMSDRIMVRGSNHQSLVADVNSPAGSRSHEAVLWRFLETLETLNSAEGKGQGDQGRGDAAFDDVIELDVEMSQEEQLKKLCVEMRRVSPFDLPSSTLDEGQLTSALEAAKNYKVKVKKIGADNDFKSAHEKSRKCSGGQPRYYGIAVEVDLAKLIPRLLDEAEGQAEDGVKRQSLSRARAMFNQLQTNSRVISRPHITLVHSSNTLKKPSREQKSCPDPERQAAQERWDAYCSLLASGDAVEFDIELGHLVWDGRVMAFSIQNVSPSAASTKALSAAKFWALQGGRGGPNQGIWRPHVTVGTSSAEIRPFEANRVMREAEMASADRGEQGRRDEVEARAVIESGLGLLELEHSDKTRYRVTGRLIGMVA